jgi:hypothetical protein
MDHSSTTAAGKKEKEASNVINNNTNYMMTMAQILEQWENAKEHGEMRDLAHHDLADSVELLCAARTLSSWKECITSQVSGSGQEDEMGNKNSVEDTHSVGENTHTYMKLDQKIGLTQPKPKMRQHTATK